MLKIEGKARGFQNPPRDLGNASKNNGWSLLLHKFNNTFTLIYEKYGTIHLYLSLFHSQELAERFH